MEGASQTTSSSCMTSSQVDPYGTKTERRRRTIISGSEHEAKMIEKENWPTIAKETSEQLKLRESELKIAAQLGQELLQQTETLTSEKQTLLNEVKEKTSLMESLKQELSETRAQLSDSRKKNAEYQSKVIQSDLAQMQAQTELKDTQDQLEQIKTVAVSTRQSVATNHQQQQEDDSKKLQQLEEELASVRKESAEQLSRTQDETKRMEAFWKNEVSELTNRLQLLTTSTKATEQQLIKEHASHEQLQKEASTLKEKIVELTNEKDGLSEKLQSVQAEFDRMQKETHKRKDSMCEQLARQERRLSMYPSLLGELATRLSGVSGSIVSEKHDSNDTPKRKSINFMAPRKSIQSILALSNAVEKDSSSMNNSSSISSSSSSSSTSDPIEKTFKKKRKLIKGSQNQSSLSNAADDDENEPSIFEVYFFLSALALKMKLSMTPAVSPVAVNQDTRTLYEEAVSKEMPFEDYYEFIKGRLDSINETYKIKTPSRSTILSTPSSSSSSFASLFSPSSKQASTPAKQILTPANSKRTTTPKSTKHSFLGMFRSKA
eukprot:TRINITY_DN3008_c0_g1_i1.p1 TRINITY_DN3008_c0_g1~~TRINITY_DN3008_c0_g1_i1.p1  ORF type:complete len:548 (-),score=139.94 TRINITY_DN3008_c0_g1_i1:100-1743(-)